MSRLGLHLALSLHTLRERWSSFLGTFVLIAVAVAAIAALGTALAAAGRSGSFGGVANLLASAALLTAFTSVFVVASTFAYSAAQRRREFALLSALGAGPRRLQAVLAGEALLVAAAAGTAAWVAG
ncbi:FtsX-like permease family protein, partial [Nocardiopsis coralliicola]